MAQAAEAAADTTLPPAGGKNLRDFSNRLPNCRAGATTRPRQ